MRDLKRKVQSAGIRSHAGEEKKKESIELSEEQLTKVSGGAAPPTISEIHFSKLVDKASPL